MSRANQKIGLIGFGCAGEGFYKVWKQSDYRHIPIKTVCVKDLNKPRNAEGVNWVNDWREVVEDPEIGIIVEATSDPEVCLQAGQAALELGKSFVTASKLPLATRFSDWRSWAAKIDCNLRYDAAVCAEIPVIQVLEDELGHIGITEIRGVLNGSTNFVLDEWQRSGADFKSVVGKAIDLGFAETDPTADLDGHDAANKLALLIAHAFGVEIHPERICRIGLGQPGPAELSFARQNNWVIRQEAWAKRLGDTLKAGIGLTFIPADHPFARLRKEENAVEIRDTFGESTWLSGRGAGSVPTGNALAADVIAVLNGEAYSYRKLQKNLFCVHRNSGNTHVYLRSTHPDLAPENWLATIYSSGKSEYGNWWVGEIENHRLNSLENELSGHDFALISLPEGAGKIQFPASGKYKKQFA